MIKFNVAACIVEQSVLALLQNHLVTPTSDFKAFHCFETREKNMKFQSRVVWVIRNSDSIIISLGVPKYWKPSCIVFLFRGSEILYPLLCCLGNQKFWILSCVVWRSEILNPLLCCLRVRNSESSPVLFGGSEILNLLCCLGVRNSESSPVLFGGQKFWILSCVVWGSEILNPLLCSWGMRNSESSPVLFGGSLGDCLEEFYDPCKQGDVSCEF